MRRDKLIEARKKAGKKQEQVAEALNVDRTTISAWERGERTPHPQQRPAYADSLRITLTELDAMLTNVPPPDDRTPVWLSTYLNAEQSATEIVDHEPHLVDGLLQTPAYAEAVARSVGVVPASEDYARRNVEQRRWRQARVNDGDLTFRVIHSEIALHIQMGSPATMAAQMDRLVELAGQPNVTVQVVPFSRSQYEALRMGSISIMRHPWVEGVSVYHLPYRDLALIEDADEAANFVAAVDHATALALSPDASLRFIAEAADRWRTTDG
jgi:transcriptional regulator with XRE-family HTH domain